MYNLENISDFIRRPRTDMNYTNTNIGGGNPNGVYNNSTAPSTAPTATTAAPAPAAYTPAPIAFNTPTEQQNMQQATDNMMQVQNDVLNSDNAYIKNARQMGLEHASNRGLLNSSIAAGASQRAAIEASQPIAQSIYARGNAKTDYYDMARLMPLQKALSLVDDFAQRALDQPDVYTPGYVNGMTNFFMSNMQNVMKNFFGDSPAGGA